MRKELKIISLSEIKTEEVKWLWYPYIPFGKVTIVQRSAAEAFAAVQFGESIRSRP